jgi:hypothetical protein
VGGADRVGADRVEDVARMRAIGEQGRYVSPTFSVPKALRRPAVHLHASLFSINEAVSAHTDSPHLRIEIAPGAHRALRKSAGHREHAARHWRPKQPQSRLESAEPTQAAQVARSPST